MDSSADVPAFTVIRIGERYTGNWPAEVRQAVTVLAAFVDQSLAAETDGAADEAEPPPTAQALRESVEKAAKERADAETAHPETFGDVPADPDDVAGSVCGAVDQQDPVLADTELVLVRGLNAYAVVSKAVG